MKRSLIAAICLLCLPLSLSAITGTPSGKRPLRVGVLRTSDGWQNGEFDAAAVAIEREMAAQLRSAGLDAFDTHQTLDAVRDSAENEADLYVEISGGAARTREVGDVGVGDRNVSATLGVMFSQVAAEVRLYDGRTLELVDRYELSHHKTVVVPTSIGFGSRDLFAQAALPLFRRIQYRAAVREVAEDAAQRIARR